jgi:hypothetical protein
LKPSCGPRDMRVSFVIFHRRYSDYESGRECQTDRAAAR